ncbi:MAG: alpha-amylase family glycosyl hydrolase [Planctomycetota bacterium]
MNSRPVFHTALFGALACCLMAALVSCNRPENHTPPAAGVFQEIERLGDTVRLESDERVAIANSRLRLEFDKSTGDWVSMTVDGLTESLVERNKPGIAIDFRVDQAWMVEEHGAKLLETSTRSDETDGSLTLQFRHGVHMREPTLLIPRRWRTSVLPPMTPPQDPYEFELISSYTLFPHERRVERSATLNRNLQRDIMTPSFRRFEGFLFVVPGAAVGATADCVVDVPGPVYTYNHVEPRTPYPALAATFVECRTAPDRYPGIVGVTNEKLRRSLAAWLDTKGEVYYQTYLSGDRRKISILMHDIRASRMGDSDTVVSDRQVLLVAETFPDAQAEQLRSVVDTRYPREVNTPDWVPEMVMIEVMPAYYPGGLRGLAERIPFYREIGFNTLYMLPHWLGGYENVDPFVIDPKVGTAEDLRNVVKVAHDNGMRVLFDMVIHGFSKKSPVVREHPEFFTRDEHGLLVTHFNWSTYNTDPSHPGYIDYMRRLVQHDAKTYGIDGYRVDANSYKSPNWDSAIDYPAWQASSTLPLYRAMMEALREIKPDAVLMSEMFGPVWHSVSNLVQDANWANVMDMNAALEAGKVTAASYKAGIASLQKSLPRAANRIRFCRNHDTSWFLKQGFAGYTPRLMAMDAVHALAGIFVAFAGDPKYPPSPDDDPAVWEYYRKILRLRKDSPELARGELLFDEIVCDDPHVMSFIRRLDGRASLVLANFSGEARRPRLSLHLPGHVLDTARLVNPQSGAEVSAVTEGDGVRFQLAPYEVLVGRLDTQPSAN